MVPRVAHVAQDRGPRRFDRRALRGPRRRRPTGGSAPCGRRADSTATISPTRPAAPAPARPRRARRCRRRHLAWPTGQSDAAGVALGLIGEIEERGQRRAARDFTWGNQLRNVEDSDRAARFAHASAELVDSEIDADDGVRHRGARQGSRSPMSGSILQRSVPPRATHHNSRVPTSVTRLSSDTGTVTSLWPASGRALRAGSSPRGRRPSPRSSRPRDQSSAPAS